MVEEEDQSDKPDLAIDITSGKKYKHVKSKDSSGNTIKKKKKPVGFVDFTTVSAVVPMMEHGNKFVGFKIATPGRDWILRAKTRHNQQQQHHHDGDGDAKQDGGAHHQPSQSQQPLSDEAEQKDWYNKILAMVTQVQNEPANMIVLEDDAMWGSA